MGMSSACSVGAIMYCWMPMPRRPLETDIEAAWKDAESSGVLQLPGRVEQSAAPAGDVTFLIEVRRGDSYRATEIAEVDPPRVKADSQVRRIYAATQRVRP